MKNVIFLVCDGLSYDITENKLHHSSPMIFLNQLREKSIDCKKAFSQAPYTEAGIMGLMYGKNPLDDGAYLYGMQEWEGSTYKSFFNAGYDLFTSYFGSYTPPELMLYGHYIYTENYFTPMFSRYIRGKLDYYKKLFDSREFQQEDLVALIKLLRRHFDTMLIWHSEKADANDCTGIYQMCEIKDYKLWTEAISTWKRRVETEHSSFLASPDKYVLDILSRYDEHFITNSCDVEGLPLKSELVSQREWVAKEYSSLFKRIKAKNRHYFLKNKQIPFRELTTSLRIDKHRFVEHLYRTYQAGWTLDTSKMVSTSLPQICSSSRAFVRSLMKWIDERESNNPFFAYLHCDEFHRPLSFYSQDIADRELVKSEFDEVNRYVDNLPKDYQGNIGFDLAAQYIDLCIKELYMFLETKGLLENTILVVTADHGSSNFGGQVRFTVTNNFYPEQYHIPVVIYNDGNRKTIESFVNIKDIPSTIMDICRVDKPGNFSGISFLEKANDHTFVEYLGTGVPDLLRRPVFYQYRDYGCAYLFKAPIDEKKPIEVVEYFNLIDDPEQMNNIVGGLSEERKKDLASKWAKRRHELKGNYLSWVMEDTDSDKEIERV